jgi:ketosteroid isomerase-like protein
MYHNHIKRRDRIAVAARVAAVYLPMASESQRSVVRLLSLMVDDAVFLNPGQVPLGRDEFSPGFSADHQQARINCISELEDVVVVGEVACTLSRDSLSVAPRAGGEAMQFAGHRITVYRNNPTAAGSWPAMPTRCPRWRSWGREMRDAPNQPLPLTAAAFRLFRVQTSHRPPRHVNGVVRRT